MYIEYNNKIININKLTNNLQIIFKTSLKNIKKDMYQSINKVGCEFYGLFC